MDIRLIEVPYAAGDDRHPASEAPLRLREAGVARMLAAKGISVTLEAVERGGPFRDTASSSAAVNRHLAAAVRRAIDASQFPLVIAGSCPAAHGVLAGFEHNGCGAIWLDAHGDFNTPETTATGFFPGMSLAILAGHCYHDYWETIGDATPLREEAMALLGVRDLSPEAERIRLARSSVEVVSWWNGAPEGDVQTVLDRLAGRVKEVYLHVDMDVFDPEIAPGVVDEPVPGGLSLGDFEAIVRAAAARFQIRAATLATYTPEKDREDKTLHAALSVIDLVGDWAAGCLPAAGR